MILMIFQLYGDDDGDDNQQIHLTATPPFPTHPWKRTKQRNNVHIPQTNTLHKKYQAIYFTAIDDNGDGGGDHDDDDDDDDDD